MQDLLVHKSNTYSQNGEDGIIEAIFNKLGLKQGVCCEFGAWDGVYLSNCRALIDQGWSALMIEGDKERYQELVANYANNPAVTCVHRFVDVGENSLGSIMRANGIKHLDFLSIDIDGLDYEIFKTLDISPTVICIEVNAGHDPDSDTKISRDVARDNVGQPLQTFVEIAERKGYSLVCYTANAFFVRSEVAEEVGLPIQHGRIAYENFLRSLDTQAKEWLYLVNLGIVNPHIRFRNPYLSREALKIGLVRAIKLRANIRANNLKWRLKANLQRINALKWQLRDWVMQKGKS